MRKAFLAAILLTTIHGAAFADGRTKPAGPPPPPPLNAPQQGAMMESAPRVHYYGDTYDGMPVSTQSCAGGQSGVTCRGDYVVVGSVIRTETMPAYVETVQPVILENGGWSAPVAPRAPAPRAHSCNDPQYCDHRKPQKKSAVTLGGDFTGGVGYNVPTYYYGGRSVIVSTSTGVRSYVGAPRAVIHSSMSCR